MSVGRKCEVVADGLPLFHGAQLAIDTTIVSWLGADGTPRLRPNLVKHFCPTLARPNLEFFLATSEKQENIEKKN